MLKVSCQYLYHWLRYRLNKENRPIVIMSTHPKLTQVPMFVLDVLDVMGRPQGSYAESYMLILRVIYDILDVVGRPQGSYTECFVSISIIG